MRLFLPVCFFLACAFAQAEQPYPLRVEWVQESPHGGALFARNDRPVPESVIVRQTQPGENIRLDKPLPLVAVVPAKSSLRLVGVEQVDAKKAWRGFAWQWNSRMGVAGAQHDPRTVYRLPWLAGREIRVIQAPGGRISTHDTPDSREAIDFDLPEGTPVAAARAGIVASTEAGFSAGRPDRSLWDKGNYVRVLHDDGTIGVYFHFKPGGVTVRAGQRVEVGSILGFSGNTGYTYGPHLHFAVLRVQRSGDQLEEVSVPVRWYAGNPPVELAVKQGATLGGGSR